MAVNLLLTSSGLHSNPAIWKEWIGMLGERKVLRVAYLPAAAHPKTWLACYLSERWRSRRAPYSLVPLYEEDAAPRLHSCDAVYVGPGDTLRLADWFERHTECTRLLKARVTDGMPYAGFSAGSIIAGPTLDPGIILDGYYGRWSPSQEPLNLTRVSVWPHFHSAEKSMPLLQAWGALWKNNAIALTDGQAVHVEGEYHSLITKVN